MSCCQQVTRVIPFHHTVAHIAMVGLGGTCAERALLAVSDALDRLERMCSPNDPGSALLRLCAAPVGQAVAVPDPLWRLLALANDVAYRTDGLFDAVAAGTDGRAGWTDLDLSARGYVRTRRRVRIALGGLIKGFAADLGVAALKEMGVPAGLVDVEGRVAAFGPSEWRVHFMAGNQSVPVPVRDGAVAVLGSGRRGGLLDPRRGMLLSAAETEANILVRAPRAAVADALAKVTALRPGSASKLLKPFGASPVFLSCQGANALQYAS